MKIGSTELEVYVHVVEEAPFEVLLGRPFFVLTSCETRETDDGGQVLRIRDPWDLGDLRSISTLRALRIRILGAWSVKLTDPSRSLRASRIATAP